LRSLRVLLLSVAATVVLGLWQASHPVVYRVRIPVRGLPPRFTGFSIAQVTDLHVGPTIRRARVQRVVNLVNGLAPDLVALTGDLVDGPVRNLAPDVAPIAQLRAPHGVYFVTGNHEYYWDAVEWMAEFAGLGVRVLANEHRLIERGPDAILLAGITDYAGNPERALAGAPDGLVKIVLAHQPAAFAMTHAAGFDLQLSGHTHAGQYFPFTLLVGFFQRFYKGLNRYRNMWIYVSRGTGYWGPPLRAFMPAEITLITLAPERGRDTAVE
jgi:predicted MPP superfamily phosphohydrolase